MRGFVPPPPRTCVCLCISVSYQYKTDSFSLTASLLLNGGLSSLYQNNSLSVREQLSLSRYLIFVSIAHRLGVGHTVT
jgi:hypothetical protein